MPTVADDPRAGASSCQEFPAGVARLHDHRGEITGAVKRLPKKDLTRFRKWFVEYDNLVGRKPANTSHQPTSGVRREAKVSRSRSPRRWTLWPGS